MQNSTDMVVSELYQVYVLARKLSENLEPSQIEICRTLAREVICYIEKAICTAKTSNACEAEMVFSDVRGGLHVERLNQEFSDKEQKLSKKRKIMASMIRHVRVSTEAGAQIPPDDGHSWRKYGQKDILGAKHPRSYYRCTYRKTQGCSAMKQVQKSDENSLILDITYLGTHTCLNSPRQSASKTSFYDDPQQNLLDQQNSLVLHLDLQTNLKVKTETLDLESQDPTSSFSFPSTPIEGMNTENVLFCSSPSIECGYEAFPSSVLMSPTSYASNLFAWPPYEMGSQAGSGQTEIISEANLETDSPIFDVECMPEYREMDAEIPFDTSIFFV